MVRLLKTIVERERRHPDVPPPDYSWFSKRAWKTVLELIANDLVTNSPDTSATKGNDVSGIRATVAGRDLIASLSENAQARATVANKRTNPKAKR